MFWGKGDSSKLEIKEMETLDHLRRMVETGHIIALTHDQSELALRALNWYSTWESSLRMLRGLRNVAMIIGGLLAIWWATGGETAIIEFIRGAGQ